MNYWNRRRRRNAAAPLDAQRPWLRSYPAGVPAEIDAGAYPSLVALLGESFRRFADRDAAICLGQRMSFAALDRHSQHLVAGCRRRPEPWRPGGRMMPNPLQYMVAIAGILRARHGGGEREPALHRARAGTPAEGLRRQGHHRAGELCHTLAEVIDETPVQHVVLASVGDMLPWWKGQLVNFLLRHLKGGGA